jgi:hypothetical protein
MRLRLIVLLLLAPISWGQQITHEEQVVRTTYAKLSYADEIGIIVRAMNKGGDNWKIPETSLDRALNSRLDFQLHNFKVGDVKEIKARITAEVSGIPQKTDPVLDVTPSTFNYHADKDPGEYALYAIVKWKEFGYELRSGSLWPLAEILKLPEMGGNYTRYATYSVTVTFESKSLTYDTLALFETKPDGSENIHFMDVHAGISMLDLLAKTTVFPSPFIKTHLRDIPVVRRWLNTNIQSCTGKYKKDGDVCCDLDSGRCGVEQHELPSFSPGIASPKPSSYHKAPTRPRLVMASYHPPIGLLINGQVACSKFTTPSPLSFPSIPSGTEDHALDANGQPDWRP